MVLRTSGWIDLSDGSQLALGVNFSGPNLSLDFLKWYPILSLRPNLVAASKIGVWEMFFGVGMKVNPLFSTLSSVSENTNWLQFRQS